MGSRVRLIVPIALVLLLAVSGCNCRTPALVETFDAGCTTEVCNGVDDDCDGQVDEDFAPLTCGVGACAVTVPACADGLLQTCEAGAPTVETCNGLDDDCDGDVDEGLADLSCGAGACARTVTACAGGVAQPCVPGTPAAETCDGVDDDCDGEVDEGLAPLSCGVGACARTVPACAGGVAQTCVAGTPTAEICDGLDNDCDGTVDDDGICQPPAVMCPASQSAYAGASVTLVASATDADGTIVFTEWTVTGGPAGSTALPATPSALSTAFTPDAAGTFTLRFCARDNAGTTTCCSTALSTAACTSPPAPPVSTACGTSWDGRPIVQFTAVPAGLRYELSLDGGALVLATAAPAENYLRPAARIASGGPPPGTATALEVRACRLTDPGCCSTPTPLSVNVVEACSTPGLPTAANVVLSEYVVSGEGACPACATCQAGESVEITNLSNCPLSLDGYHFAYRNSSNTPSSYRWMNFSATDVIPPRGVYVTIRNLASAPVCGAPLGAESPGLYGLRISTLAMQGDNLCNGWFNNTGGGLSEMQVASGVIATAAQLSFSGPTIARVAPYLSGSASCVSTGFDAVDSCGTIVGGSTPSAQLSPNQLGRLWHPCDAVVGPVPACVRD
jgi:hypothetical protein